MKQQLRALLEEVGGLACPASQLKDGDDLFAAGLTSFATVSVMLTIEQEFALSFPDSLLTRATFTSIDTLAAAIASLQELDRAA